jgi:prepilin-type processing-associated H-X9-DG protein
MLCGKWSRPVPRRDDSACAIGPVAPDHCVINCNNYGSNFYSFHPGGVSVAMGDGSVRFLKATIATDTVYKLVGRSDGNIVSSDAY